MWASSCNFEEPDQWWKQGSAGRIGGGAGRWKVTREWQQNMRWQEKKKYYTTNTMNHDIIICMLSSVLISLHYRAN